jgi:antirestriction protein ArdC
MTRDDAQARITDTLTQLTTDARWPEFLRVMAKFHRYSLNNTLLIFAQRPEATMVNGYRAWPALGRQVQKGERGITILAPLVKWEQDENQEVTVRVVGFRTVSVFDVAQTHGEPVRGLPERLLTAKHGSLLAAVEAAIPFPVSRVPDLGGANGVFHTRDRTIALLDHLAPDMQVKTLLHEWAHGLRSPEDTRSRGEEEVVAESTAYVVASHFGLDTRAYSVAYVASWSRGDGKADLAMAEEILRRSQKMVEPVEERLKGQDRDWQPDTDRTASEAMER